MTSPNMHGSPKQTKSVTVHVTRDDILAAECRNPNKCMIKVAVKRALNLAHGYIHVDATGISISRNGTYREKAFLTKPVLRKLLAFDRHETVTPFSFTADFLKTKKIFKITPQQRKEYTARARRTKNSKKKYDMRSRVIGVALAGGGAQ